MLWMDKEGADASAPAFHMKKIYEYKSEVSLCCWEDLAVKQGYEKDFTKKSLRGINVFLV